MKKTLTPKEQAKKLSMKFDKYGETDNAKQCALIAVDEILQASPSLPILGDGGSFGEDIVLSKDYWEQVKKEIENV